MGKTTKLVNTSVRYLLVLLWKVCVSRASFTDKSTCSQDHWVTTSALYAHCSITSILPTPVDPIQISTVLLVAVTQYTSISVEMRISDNNIIIYTYSINSAKIPSSFERNIKLAEIYLQIFTFYTTFSVINCIY